MAKHKKKLVLGIAGFIVLAIASVLVFAFCVHADFNRKGISAGLPGLISGDTYPDWEEDEEVSRLDCSVLEQSGLSVSHVYLIRRGGQYQVRLRIGRTVPFTREDLPGDIRWKVEDGNGGSYTDDMSVYAERVGWINCVNVTLVLDENEYLSVSGGKITFSAVCVDSENTDVENEYARCTAEITF